MIIRTDVLVVGAGVVGLAVSRKFSLEGQTTILVDKATAFGTETSSRNSEVIHAGLYYPQETLKAQLCVRGRELLYQYCLTRRIPHKNIGKYVVAVTEEDEPELDSIFNRAKANGCNEVRMLSSRETSKLRPDLRCQRVLDSPRTGIIDSHSFMLSLLCDFEAAGGTFAPRNRVTSFDSHQGGISASLEDGTQVVAGLVVNCAGLDADELLFGKDREDYDHAFARGDYFSYAGNVPFDRLVYPTPQPGGLGIHLTLDLAGCARFGPDVTWVKDRKYVVDESKAAKFCAAVSRYWPGVEKNRFVPAYSGIRPKVRRQGVLLSDFLILPRTNAQSGLAVNLLGIESPGLTCSLALAEYVFELTR